MTMLKDALDLNAKGQVKLELYNEAGEVFFTKEKHNLVVLDANKIVANMMAQPSRKTRISSKVAGDTQFNGEGLSTIVMEKHREEVKTVTSNFGSTPTLTAALEGNPYVTEILSATIGGVVAEVGTRVFIEDGPNGVIGFSDAGATGQVIMKYRYIVNDMIDIVRGSEKVVIAGTDWKKAKNPSDTDLTYAVNYATGEIIFENPKANVTVTYDYEMQYSLGFMGIGGLPVGHQEGRPVSYPKSEKYRTTIDNEFADARQPINFPLTIEEGQPEIDVLLAKNISTVDRTLQTIQILPDAAGTGLSADYNLDITTINGSRPIFSFTRAEVATGTLVGHDLLAANDFTFDAQTGAIQLSPSLLAAGLVVGDKIEFDYKLKAGTDHLVYQLNYSPVVELKAVRFENNLGTVVTIPVDAATRGMEFGATGKVRVLNANAGTIEFDEDFEAELANNPGKITVEYFVNSGTVVKFIADFPKGVPGPMVMDAPDFIADTTTGAVAHDLPHEVHSITEVLINGTATTAFAVNGKRVTINDPAYTAGVTLVIKYKMNSKTHTIYTVGMFDSINPVGSKMFNISGIGPITKDENTGMRITWSVTF